MAENANAHAVLKCLEVSLEMVGKKLNLKTTSCHAMLQRPRDKAGAKATHHHRLRQHVGRGITHELVPEVCALKLDAELTREGGGTGCVSDGRTTVVTAGTRDGPGTPHA